MSVTPTGREDGEIQAILLDSGLEEDADLRRSLEELRGMAQVAAPAPRADLAALLTPGVASLELRRRNRQRRMGIVVSAAVVGAMGLGAGAVAASSEDFRRSVGHTVENILQPAGRTAPKPDTAPPSPADLPPVPGPTGSTVPSAPVKAGTASPSAPAGAEPGHSNGSAEPGDGKQILTPPAQPTHVPAIPGTGSAPKLPAKPLPSLPSLPPTVPGAVPSAIPAEPVPGKP
jgi:hypothetical protein